MHIYGNVCEIFCKIQWIQVQPPARSRLPVRRVRRGTHKVDLQTARKMPHTILIDVRIQDK